VNTRILRLSIAGHPLEWLDWQGAANLYARGLVSWTLGDTVYTVRGGTSRLTGKQSTIGLHSIIACAGEIHIKRNPSAPLTNRALFRRDLNLCMYCSQTFTDCELTRDHIIPTSRGGRDNWLNVVAACRRCNQRKGSRLPEECGMEVIAVPYRPNKAEYLALINSSRILADQMDFLKSQFSANARWS
jgi:5-methylcytosine-specific restriction endonuclease McrA